MRRFLIRARRRQMGSLGQGAPAARLGEGCAQAWLSPAGPCRPHLSPKLPVAVVLRTADQRFQLSHFYTEATRQHPSAEGGTPPPWHSVD
jgi:hypothetical protein